MTSPLDSYASIAELYDHFPLYTGRPDVAFYVDEARSSGGPVLEIGCGSGRVLIPSARAGATMVGLDASEAMLERCRANLAGESDEVRSRASVVAGDMRHFDLGRTFSLVTIPFRPFQHLTTVEDQLACLTSVRRHLADGGRLVFDLFNPAFERLAQPVIPEEIAEDEPFDLPDGRRVTRSFRIVRMDRANQVNDVELVYHVAHADGRQERLVQAFGMRYLFRYEAEHLLARAGFSVDAVYAGFDRAPYGSVYPGELVFLARRS